MQSKETAWIVRHVLPNVLRACTSTIMRSYAHRFIVLGADTDSLIHLSLKFANGGTSHESREIFRRSKVSAYLMRCSDAIPESLVWRVLGGAFARTSHLGASLAVEHLDALFIRAFPRYEAVETPTPFFQIEASVNSWTDIK